MTEPTVPKGTAEQLTVPSQAWPFVCTNCGRAAPAGLGYCCPTCGGIYDLGAPTAYAPAPPSPGREGLGRFRSSFPLPEEAPWITLGEGGTPLIASTIDDRTVHFKCEHLNPTGSFKDRGASVLISALAAAGVVEAIEDSSGNAGAAFAAYAARAGIRARVFLPDGASPRKRAQISAYGAEIVRLLGPRSQVAEAVRRQAEAGAVYASHVWLPFGLAGFATLAFELVEQLGEPPAAVLLPAGHGTLVLGLARGFAAMQTAGAIDRIPKLIAAQAAACAPLWAAHQAGGQAVGWVREGETRADGIRILQPLRGDAVLNAVETSGGTIVALDEPSIARGEAELARRGFFVEPTSAVVWGALEACLRSLPDPVVAILTGSGLKSEPGSPPRDS
jgi:threonine synthase